MRKFLVSQIMFLCAPPSFPYDIFFGCVSSLTIEQDITYYSLYSVGWFGYNRVYRHKSVMQNCEAYGYNSNEIEEKDVLQFTFDCGKRQIELFHERLNKTHILEVDIKKAPLPWQLLLILSHTKDCVRILT